MTASEGQVRAIAEPVDATDAGLLRSDAPASPAFSGLAVDQLRSGSTTTIHTRDVVRLQRKAGNQAVSRLLTQRSIGHPNVPTIQRQDKTKRADVGTAAETIVSYFVNAQSADKREAVLQELLLNHDRADELRKTYKSNWSRDLDTDLASMSSADAVRAFDSLDYGELRPMSKVLIAIGGAGTDKPTLWRVLKEANKAAPTGTGIARFETMWTTVVGHLPKGVFDRFQSETLAQALNGDLWVSDLVKAHAILGYGDLRPIDKVYISMVQATTDEAMLFEGLAGVNADTIEADFKAYEFRGVAFSDNAPLIWDALDSELSGEDYRRALALLSREPNPDYGLIFGSSEKTRKIGNNMRLVALVKAAVKGLGTNFELIMSSIDSGTTAEVDELRKQVEDKSDPLGLAGVFGDLSGGEMSRLRAKLGIKEAADDAAGTVDASMLADPTVQLLRGMGGVDGFSVYDSLKRSAGATWARFKAEYDKQISPFNRYVTANTQMPESAYVQTTILKSDLDLRLNFCFGDFSDDEDYLYHLLGNFATNSDRRRLSADVTFMDKLRGNLSTTEVHRAFVLLKPSDLSPKENAAWLAQAVDRERQGTFDLFTSTGDAVQDENRQLQTGTQLAYLDANLSPEERKLLDARAAKTQMALDDYVVARDEFINTASMIANVAVSVIIGALTAGAAGPVLLAQLARAAAAMAIAKVLTEKVIRGDQFDIIGADGAVAFATGAVEGVMNVGGAMAAKGVIGPTLEAVGLSAQRSAGTLFRGAARGGLLAITEGSIAGGSVSLVDSMARDETWRDGLLAGLEQVAASTATGAGTGAGTALSLHAALGGLKALKFAKNETLPLAHADNPLVGRAIAGDADAARKIVSKMERWETGVRELEHGSGFAAGLPDQVRKDLIAKLVAHRQSIVAHLTKEFGAAPVPGASTEAISDMDLNIKGDNAGQKLLAAEQYLASAYGAEWRVKYRMGLLVDASRIGTLEEVMASLPDAAKARVRARITQETATLIFARRLHLASEAERAAMLADPPAGVDIGRARSLSELEDKARLTLRNQALMEGDRLLGELRAATDPQVRQQLAEKVTVQQMLANTMDDEAYLSGGGVKGFALGQKLTNAFEQYQALLDQIGMIAHVVREAKGVLEAARSYELFKYINRICSIFEQAGITDERLAFFKNWSDLAYRVDREATGALDRPGGAKAPSRSSLNKANVATDFGAPQKAPSDQFLLDNYQRFAEMVEQQGQTIGKRAQAEGGAGDGSTGARPAQLTGAPQLLRLPPATAADGTAPSAALPKALRGEAGPLVTRLLTSRKTLEQELGTLGTGGEYAAQKAIVQRALDDVLAKPLRELSPTDLALSSTLQQRLFEAAGGAVERMKSFARTALKGANAEVISIRKREDLAGFVNGIIEKCGRKDYSILSQMDDVIRGRLNIEDGQAVGATANAMRAQSEFPVKEFVEPRVNDAGVVRYPRYHVIVEDPQTGLTHEWQIGTQATSTLYEQQGIKIPSELQDAASRLGKHFRADIHDIEYDVFQAFAKREPGIASELGIPQFIADVAQASQRSAGGSADTALNADVAKLHADASRLLQALVDRQGPEYVAGLFH